MKRCVVVYNPISGKEKNRESIEDFYAIIKKYGYDLELIYTKKRGDATKIIKNLGHPDLVIVAGGDGTLNEAIKGNLSRKDRLLIGILPLGTTNDVANMLGYSKDYVKNLEMLLSGNVCKYDVGLINNNPFIYVAAFGGLTNIPYVTSGKQKRKYGHLAYLMQALKEIPKQTKQFDLRYKINGKTYQGVYSYFFVTNTNVVGGKRDIYKNIKLDDHLMEVVFVKAKSKIDLSKIFLSIMTSNIENCPNIEYYQTSNVEILFNEEQELSWCLDGEELVLKTSKVKIGVNSDNMLLIPNKNIESLFKQK